MSIGPRGVTDWMLLDRINSALTTLMRLQQVTASWSLSVRQRRGFVKTFVISVCDYLSYQQPMTSAGIKGSGELERQCASYILAVSVRKHWTARSLAIARILPPQDRRRRHLIKAVSKFCQPAVAETASAPDSHNCNTIHV